tara:strand:+ start:14313 stop:14498 length:186 start_codon:yes stop_codon:yes gene_type:complete
MSRRTSRRRLDFPIKIIAKIILNDQWNRNPGIKAYGSGKLFGRDIGGSVRPLLELAFNNQI